MCVCVCVQTSVAGTGSDLNQVQAELLMDGVSKSNHGFDTLTCGCTIGYWTAGQAYSVPRLYLVCLHTFTTCQYPPDLIKCRMLGFSSQVIEK